MSGEIRVRKAEERGKTETNWLESFHTFSFNQYVNPTWNQFHVLRVLNEDYVEPGQGFPTHGHSEMEILTYVLEGAIHHKDSTGSDGIIHQGEIQRMSAGTGVRHSEKNASDTEPLHFLQIWILPQENGISPSYEKKKLPERTSTGMDEVGSPVGRGEGVGIHQDCFLYRGRVRNEETVAHEMENNRAVWLQVVDGEGTANGEIELAAGDGLGIVEANRLQLSARTELEFLLFNMRRRSG